MRYVLAVLAFVVSVSALAVTVTLDTTSVSLEMETSTAAQVDYVASYLDVTSSLSTPKGSQGSVSSATTTTIISAPAASASRAVQWISFRNRSTSVSQTITLKTDSSGTERHILTAFTLAPAESAVIDREGKLTVYTSKGLRRRQMNEKAVWPYFTRTWFFTDDSVYMQQNGTYFYTARFNNGLFPPKNDIATSPGINGFNTDCSVQSSTTNPFGADQMGTPLWHNSNVRAFLLPFWTFSQRRHANILIDVLWVNRLAGGISGSTEAISMAALPARDINGSSDGDGLGFGIFSTSTGNQGASCGCQASFDVTYTDSEGNPGNVVRCRMGGPGFATGSFAFCGLAPGDYGVRSIEQFAIVGTNYPAWGMAIYRILDMHSQYYMRNTNHPPVADRSGYPRVYNGTCPWVITRDYNASFVDGPLYTQGYSVIEEGG